MSDLRTHGTIEVLISGGVDSAVAVWRLLEQGYDLHLFYIRIGMDDGRGDCSAEEDIEMCSFIAKRFGLPFDVVSLHEEYWENVMEYALQSVKSGLTPNPDVMCNRMI
nr:tRNA 2-thiouridine(34) synthase MnmA [Duncaniella sp.]